MREKPTCQICHAKFTRKGNLFRHMEDLHGISTKALKKDESINRLERIPSFDSELGKDAIVDGDSFYRKFDKSMARISQLTKLSEEYIKSLSYFQTLNNLGNNLAIREKEIKDITSNNWIIPVKEIQGLSGFICRRCIQLGFTPVRNIGYDMTKEASHICDEEKVKSLKMCSIREADLWHRDNFLVSRMIEFLNYYMPGRRYIRFRDISVQFNGLVNNFGLETAKTIFGVPDRLYLYSLKKGDMKNWIKRMLANVGTKIMVEESDIRELLMMVKSTYAILEIPNRGILRRIVVCITS